VVDSKEENGSSNTIIKTFPYLTITVYIPTACVGVLIGKRGSNIDSIQKLSAKESTKSHAGSSQLSSSSRGGRNKSAKQNKNNGNSNGNQKAVSPESVRISVVNYPPPPTNAQHQQNFENFKNPHNLGESGHSASSGQQQQKLQQIGGSSLMDMGVPPTYTELDFSDPQWTPIVIRADPIAAIYAANAINDICCPEYVIDRNQLVYIMDVPVPAVAAGNTNNANLRHASIVGKRGNKLIQLSADHKCRIMVPPKQLGHNLVQLEAPLKECCSCLKAISAKLQAGSTSGIEEKEPQHQHQGDAIKTLPTSPPSKNAKNNATSSNKANNSNKNKNDNAKNNFQMTLIIQPLPSQTKLRNIARKTETKILKKRISKQQRNQKHHQQQKQDQDQESKQQPEQTVEEGEAGDQHQEKQEQGANNNNSNNDSKVSWRLTVVATSEKKVMKAVDMLKVLNSKGYEVIVEELGASNYIDTSNKSVSESTENDTDADAGTDSLIVGGPVDGSKAAATSTATATSNGNNGRSGGRGGRNKKPRHRNNHRERKVTTATTTAAAAVGDS